MEQQLAINLKLLKSLIDEVIQNNINKAVLEKFNNTYGLKIQTPSPQQVYLLAEIIQKRAQKQFNEMEKPNYASITNRWFLGEKTLYFASFLYYFSLKRYTVERITEQGLIPIQKIFVTKSLKMLYFYAKHLLKTTLKRKRLWKQDDIQILYRIMNSESYSDLSEKEKGVKWKHIAFELFVKSKSGEFYTAKECRQKWLNHLSPQLTKSEWSIKQQLDLFKCLIDQGCRWSLVSKKMGGIRTDHSIKNRAKALIKKAFKKKIKKIDRKHLLEVFQALNKKIMNQQELIDQENSSSGQQSHFIEGKQHQNEERTELTKKQELDQKTLMEKQEQGTCETFQFIHHLPQSRLILFENLRDQWEYDEEQISSYFGQSYRVEFLPSPSKWFMNELEI